MKPTRNDRLAVDRELASRSLSHFVRMAWRRIDSEPYLHNWHVDAVCEHLEAMARGDITRLIINVPPGTSKSMLTCVFFPAWLWGPGKRPDFKMITASFSADNAKRDNRRTRDLVTTPWYQARWPISFKKLGEEYVENTKRGFRQSSSVTGITGKRGHGVFWDDPLNPEGANSDADRAKANRIFSETLPLRVINPVTSFIGVIMQRLHENDVTGYALSKELGYEHLMLPMEFEPERKCYTSIGFEDPRTKDGELLHKKRFPRSVVERDKKALGSYGTSGQLQQRPVPRGGGMFKRHWFNIIPAAPAKTRWVRGWDLAATPDPKADWTVGLRMGEERGSDGAFVISDVQRIQGSPRAVDRLIYNTATQDGRRVKGSLPQDPGQAGKAQVQYLIKRLAGYSYRATPESGDKVTRAKPFAAQCEAGNVSLVEGDWNDEFLDEICKFPFGKWDDQVDAASRAFAELVEGSTYNIDFS